MELYIGKTVKYIGKEFPTISGKVAQIERIDWNSQPVIRLPFPDNVSVSVPVESLEEVG